MMDCCFVYSGMRCKGVSNSSVQIPCRSGSPHGVFRTGADAGGVSEAVADCCATVTCAGLKNTTVDTITAAAPINVRSRVRTRHLLPLHHLGIPGYHGYQPPDGIIIFEDHVGVQRLRLPWLTDPFAPPNLCPHFLTIETRT